jgi:hypothetical protein
MVIGNPRHDLKYAEEEAREIAAELDTKALIGFAATTQRVLDDLGNAAVTAI